MELMNVEMGLGDYFYFLEGITQENPIEFWRMG
jgi:hypothetical protein